MKYILQDNNSKYYKTIDNIINDNKEEIFSFFNHEVIDLPITIYVYKTIKDLVEGLKQRGYTDNPDYMCACQKDEDNSLNFIEPNEIDNWSEEDYNSVIYHELIHAIQYNLFGTTPEWLNEGIAKYLDGTYSKGIKYLLDNYINNNPIPKQEEIENEFGMHEYDSYDYAYLMVSYLIDTYGKDKLIDILTDIKQLDEYKDNLLNNAIEYYNNIKEL